ncbi:hypothetical protein H9L13_01125 [Sphingomonas lutea]|uniref:Uncharacterized protein n=1 Tax=Sphingomonas lutea TaxID=1045317 RepID=A0A7G9SIB8_9SPHN|nr:hypothetical protein [Sphingomonas lutea]QNN67593.1 hypothetical protein H9L13_01125 [Sphingomonas lutea]
MSKMIGSGAARYQAGAAPSMQAMIAHVTLLPTELRVAPRGPRLARTG